MAVETTRKRELRSGEACSRVLLKLFAAAPPPCTIMRALQNKCCNPLALTNQEPLHPLCPS